MLCKEMDTAGHRLSEVDEILVTDVGLAANKKNKIISTSIGIDMHHEKNT